MLVRDIGLNVLVPTCIHIVYIIVTMNNNNINIITSSSEKNPCTGNINVTKEQQLAYSPVKKNCPSPTKKCK